MIRKLVSSVIILSIIMCVLVLSAFSGTSASNGSYILGDSDNDEVVTVSDVTLIQRVLASIDVDDEEGVRLRGDVDFDGLSVSDATNIQFYLARYENTLGIGERIGETTEETPTKDKYELPFVPV